MTDEDLQKIRRVVQEELHPLEKRLEEKIGNIFELKIQSALTPVNDDITSISDALADLMVKVEGEIIPKLDDLSATAVRTNAAPV